MTFGVQLHHIGARYDVGGHGAVGEECPWHGVLVHITFLADCRYCDLELKFDFWGFPVDDSGRFAIHDCLEDTEIIDEKVYGRGQRELLLQIRLLGVTRDVRNSGLQQKPVPQVFQHFVVPDLLRAENFGVSDWQEIRRSLDGCRQGDLYMEVDRLW